MSIDRRTLLKRSCLTAAGAALPAWKAAGIFRSGAQARAAADTVLVVVRLDGGNDGLNTVVPFADPAYAAARTRIGLTGSQLLPIDARTGLHPSLSSLHGYLESGKLAIIQSVGYPVQDMSHFRSTDIWESAVPERVEPSGWLGRALDRLYPMDGDGLHSALVGGGELAFLGDYNYVTTPDIAGLAVPRGPVDQIKASLAPIGAPNHDYVGHIGSIAIADATAVDAAVAAYSSTIVYPDSSLGGSLKLTASVLSADLGPRVFWVTQSGYDTHNSQLGDHEKLLLELDQALDAFYRDLVAHGQDQRVIVMTFSEFGRRVEDNGSGGTDHGTASVMFVLGSKVRGGFFGTPPSLTDLDPDGNLKYSADFRQVYASVLANWIDTDPVPVLYGKYPTLAFL